MRLTIATTTNGSPLELSVPRGETVEGLRARVSHKLRVHADRIVLLHKDRQLTSGKLAALGVTNGSKLTLVPVIEAGLSTSRCDRNTVDALESLTDIQISDFLSGHSPLNILMGIGAHLMYVQLQLSERDVAAVAQIQDSRSWNNNHLQSDLSTTRMNCINSESACFETNKCMDTALDSCTPSSQYITEKHAISSVMTTSTSHLPDKVDCFHNSYPPQTKNTPSSDSSHLYSPQPATTAISLNSSNNGPPSPVLASTFTEGNGRASSGRLSGAVIERLESHTPGVFSGSFSGTLAPHSESQITHSRPGVAIIEQILNDLLNAACVHKGALANLASRIADHCPEKNVRGNPPHTAEDACKPVIKQISTQSRSQVTESPGKNDSSHCMSSAEKQSLHYKLEHLQFLMNQKRLQRQTRRSSHLSRTSLSCQRRKHHTAITHELQQSSNSHNSRPL